MSKLNIFRYITLKRVLLALGGLIGFVALGTACFVLYFMIPSGFQSRDAEGPGVLTELLEMAEKSQSFNPDPYISSTYRPGNPLYEPVLNIQRRRWDLAEKQLQPLVKNNNADAMFWLAHITYRTGFYASGSAAQLFQRSAELGNPYAALRLDADNIECQRHMGYYCDKKWGKLGRKLLQQRAAQGDLKAAYYQVKIDISDFSDSSEKHKQLEHLVTENAKNHYYQPLMDLIYSYMYNSYATLFNKKNASGSDRYIIVKIAILSANNNYPPVLFDVILGEYYKFIPSDYLKKSIKKIIKIDSDPYTCMSYYAKISNKIRKNVIQGASCAVVREELGFKQGVHMYKNMLERAGVKPLTQEEINQAKEMAPKLINQMTPVIYIDEMNPRP